MSDTSNASGASTLIAAARLDGVAVYGPAREKLGAAKDVYLDMRTGHAEFVRVAVGGVLGVGEKQFPVPWSALRYDARLDGFVIGLDQAALEAGPALGDYESVTDDDGWGQDVRDYYTQVVLQPAAGEGRHFTHGTSAATSDMAVDGQVRHDDKSVHAPHSRPIDPPASDDKVDHLADKVERAESRQEALIDEGVEESFPASDPPSVKRIT